MTSWLSSLFKRKVRKKKAVLTEQDISRIIEMIQSRYDRDVVCKYFNISNTTYYKYKRIANDKRHDSA